MTTAHSATAAVSAAATAGATAAATDLAIRVSALSKTYPVYDRPLDALLEIVTGRRRHTDFHALRGVDFEVRRGERIGIVGANGAGKSTLLKILSGTVDHTGGSFDVTGRLRAVLELGTGFHEESTGRENIEMGGLCMGYGRRELAERADWIIDFAELRGVIERPLRTYSSGMKSRLMYAVAFCLPVEIMIVDEALSTGDGNFVRKCTQHIVDMCSHGTTALVVSHNLYFLERLCDRVIYLRDGEVVADGDSLEVCKLYEADLGRAFVASEGSGFVRGAVNTSEVAGAAPPGTAATVTPVRAADPTRPAPGSRGPNGPGEILSAEGTWTPMDFSGAEPVRHLQLVRLLETSMLDADGRVITEACIGQDIRFRFVIESRVRKPDCHVGIMIWHARDEHVATTTNICALDDGGRPDPLRVDLREGVWSLEVALPAQRLGAGHYWLKLGVHPGWEHFSDDDQFCAEMRCLAFSIIREDHVQDVYYEPTSRWETPVLLRPLDPVVPAPPVRAAAEPLVTDDAPSTDAGGAT